MEKNIVIIVYMLIAIGCICSIVYGIYGLIKKPNYRKGSCINCGCQQLSLLRSLNIKKCTSCGHEMKWNLDPGQMPLVRSNRMVKRKK